MKTKSIIIGLLTSVLCVLVFTGCVGAPIEAASTRLKSANPLTGRSVEITLPKNLDADTLKVSINPQTGTYELSAAKLKTDASTVIESAGVAQAQALASMSGTLNNLTAILQQWIVKQSGAPASAPPEPARTNPAGNE